MAGTEQNVLILGSLPRFRGNLRKGEDPRGTSDVDVRTFLRSLEIQFKCRNITEDSEKTQILFNQIEKSTGDAIHVLNAFAGLDINYESLKEELLTSYPQHERTDFIYAAHSVMRFNLNPQEPLRSISQLEMETRAAVEAFLSGKHRERERVYPQNVLSEQFRTSHEDSELPPSYVLDGEESDDSETEQESDTAGTSGGKTLEKTSGKSSGKSLEKTSGKSSEKTSGGTPRVEGGRTGRRRVVYSQGLTQTPREFLTAQELLHSFIMHLHLATQLETETYKEVAKSPIGLRSTMLKAKATRAMEKHSSDQKKRSVRKIRSEVLYEIRPDNNATRNNESRECFLCGRKGHLKKDCRVPQKSQTQTNVYCRYCKARDHTAKKCDKRIKKGISFCNRCERIGHQHKDCKSDQICNHCTRRGHTANECRTRKSMETNNGRYQKNKYQTSREAIRNIEEWDDADEDDSDVEGSDVINIIREVHGELAPEREQTNSLHESVEGEGQN